MEDRLGRRLDTVVRLHGKAKLALIKVDVFHAGPISQSLPGRQLKHSSRPGLFRKKTGSLFLQIGAQGCNLVSMPVRLNLFRLAAVPLWKLGRPSPRAEGVAQSSEEAALRSSL